MKRAPSRVIAWTLPREKSGWPPIFFISCSCVAKSSSFSLLRAESYGPLSSIAPLIPVSCSVTEGLVMTEEPSGIRARTVSR